MTEPHDDVLTDRERQILADPVPPHLNRWDVDDPPHCHHCARPASYALILGKVINRVGMRKKDVCDACLERLYSEIDAELAAKILSNQASGDE